MLTERTSRHKKNHSSVAQNLNSQNHGHKITAHNSRSKSNHGPQKKQTVSARISKRTSKADLNHNIPLIPPIRIKKGENFKPQTRRNSQVNSKRTHKSHVSVLAKVGKDSSREKSRDKEVSREKQTSREIKNQIKKRMSFQSPYKKGDQENFKNFTLLNYIFLREKRPSVLQKINTIDHQNPKKSQEKRLKDFQYSSSHNRSSSKHKMAKPVPSKELTRADFESLQVLGKGGFGRVVKVMHNKSRKIYAMKEMSKSVIITKKSIQSVLSERELLAQLRHPYLVNMTHAFQDRSNLYLVMQYMPGGDLRYQIGKWERFPEHVVKFFVCCIVLALKYLHENAIIHRDIKPENIIVDRQGYLRLTDLGVAKVWESENFSDTSGTPGYMAPEVINRENHSYEVDIFALGVIAYECMLGKRPYRGYNRQQIREQILLYEASIKPNQLPANWDPQAADCINKLLKRKPSERLGASKIQSINGKPPVSNIQEIMKHPWFNDIEWDKMITKQYPSPFMPNFQDRNYDTVSDSEYDEETVHKMAQNELLLRKNSIQELFEDYEYNQV